MVKILYNHSRRHHILAYALAKECKGVEVEYSAEKESGCFNYQSLIDLLQNIPEISLETMEYLNGWKLGMTYPEITKITNTLEESDIEGLQPIQKTLLFFLLYSETIFVNLHKAGKLKSLAKVDKFYTEQLAAEGDLIKEYEKQKKADTKPDDQASFDIGLPEGYRVVTRFPPEPSGYMHIGHAKAALLNQYFAEKYHGQLIIRMDDTNPSKEKGEFEESIMEDISSLGIKGNVKTRTSNHFDLLLDFAKQMIEMGLAYCDNTPVEQMRMERDKGIHSKNRTASVRENMSVFNKMISTNECDDYCLRAKINMEDLNKAMRDPVIYRVNLTPHHYTGTKYRVYPTYDFACPIIDSIEGVTLALRTSEYRDRNPQYMWFISALSLKNRPIIWDFSRLNFKKTVLSKRNLKELVEQGRVNGWDDPRMPTIRGILRKGLTKQALKEYVIMQGPSKNTVLLEWDKLWAINSKIVEKSAKKIHGISKDDMIDIKILPGASALASGDRVVTETLYISKSDLGSIAVGDDITLMGLGTFKLTETSPLTAKPHETHPKYTKARLTWVPEESVAVATVEYGDLLTIDKMDERGINEAFNEDSRHEVLFQCDERVKSVSKGDFVQIEKRGIYYVDSAQPLVLNLVPTTKQNNRKI
ncbi:glutamyl-tRNA synthetase [Nematocida ausubeli]|uniref:Probable glutamate--tRNA ligase, cytoplasmic n=1 Tax=Nematocida ausubeli (strain ATCC PRA-371 / ERTm2) TaxID=1913371 RepID=A0A086J331_NEMA1|nr:glutamyl-tRNA synthetase [Nematocida ausubeli]KFG26549.1 glutamyl-tRNA synthetase [Nematocida ausubeli]